MQYFIWVGNVLTGDMGIAAASKQPIMGLVFRKFRKSLPLAASGIVLE